MSIENFYTTSFTTKRLKADQSVYEANLTGKKCHIQQDTGEPVEFDEGAFYTIYNMWCAVIDIIVGDQVIIDSTIYQVKEVKTLDMGGHPHLEIILGLAI